MCGWRHQRDVKDPTLDKRITHWSWYLPDKKQEQVQIQNLLQEPSQEKIYGKYALPFGNSSHRNGITYSFDELFNTLRKWRVMNFIIMFLI